MLEDLTIINGEMALEFDPLNTKYTITLNDNEDTELKFDYVLKDNYQMSVVGNFLDKDVNEVVLTVFNEDDIVNYYLTVYKEDAEDVSNTNISKVELEVPLKKEISPYAAPGIAVSCFVLILIIFVLLFHRKRKN